jgi:hypothetical protein
MESAIIKTFHYNGLSFENVRKCKPRKCVILGVLSPPDPGLLTVRVGEEEKQVPEFALQTIPRINWNKMLTAKQKKVRRECGFLFGNGVSKEEMKLIPITECPTLP